MNPERFAGLVTVLVFNAALSSASIADEAGVLAMAPWSGSAEVFRTGENTLFLNGSFSGIFYFRKGENPLDSALMICPFEQTISMKEHTAVAKGKCTLQQGDDSVFSEWSCEGPLGICKGQLKFTGGMGKMAGISGGGRMMLRAPLSQTAFDLKNGTVHNAMGLALWPELIVTLPGN